MKSIPNITTAIDGNFEKEGVIPIEVEIRKTTYADLIRITMNQLVEGTTTAVMKKNFRVLDAVEKAVKEKTMIELEDADAAHLKEKVNSMKWNFQHREILQFENDINESITNN